MRKLIYMVFASAAVCLAIGCSGKFKPDGVLTIDDALPYTADYEDSAQTELDEIMLPDSVPIDYGRGELGIFDLRGPVHTMKQGEDTEAFNRNGFWMLHNGQPLSTLYPGGIERDEGGRIVKGKMDKYEDLYIGYKYNEDQLVKEIEYREYMDDCYSVHYYYDNNGYVRSYKDDSWGMPEPGDENFDGQPMVFTCTIIDKDKYGNWTKRKEVSSEGETRYVTRTITYYED